MALEDWAFRGFDGRELAIAFSVSAASVWRAHCKIPSKSGYVGVGATLLATLFALVLTVVVVGAVTTLGGGLY